MSSMYYDPATAKKAEDGQISIAIPAGAPSGSVVKSVITGVKPRIKMFGWECPVLWEAMCVTVTILVGENESIVDCQQMEASRLCLTRRHAEGEVNLIASELDRGPLG